MSFRPFWVALLAEGVDRNVQLINLYRYYKVALLAEGVDRNVISMLITPQREVALLAEGVDRNFAVSDTEIGADGSPSSRRAWIEIAGTGCCRSRGQSRPPRGGRG